MSSPSISPLDYIHSRLLGTWNFELYALILLCLILPVEKLLMLTLEAERPGVHHSLIVYYKQQGKDIQPF